MMNAATFNEYKVFSAESIEELERVLNELGRVHYKLVHLEMKEGKVYVVMERISTSV